MAAVAATAMTGSGQRTLTETTLAGSDTMTYNKNKRAVLILRNPTAGALSPVIDGDGASTVPASGIGVIDISSGYAVGSIAAGAAVAIPLDTIFEYLAGSIVISSGVGLVASLLEF